MASRWIWKRRVLNIADIVAERVHGFGRRCCKNGDVTEFILVNNQEYDGNNGAALIRQHKETSKAELTGQLN